MTCQWGGVRNDLRAGRGLKTSLRGAIFATKQSVAIRYLPLIQRLEASDIGAPPLTAPAVSSGIASPTSWVRNDLAVRGSQ